MTQVHTTSRGYVLTAEQMTRRGSILTRSAGKDNQKVLAVLHRIGFASSSKEVDSILSHAEKLTDEEEKGLITV